MPSPSILDPQTPFRQVHGATTLQPQPASHSKPLTGFRLVLMGCPRVVVVKQIRQSSVFSIVCCFKERHEACTSTRLGREEGSCCQCYALMTPVRESYEPPSTSKKCALTALCFCFCWLMIRELKEVMRKAPPMATQDCDFA